MKGSFRLGRGALAATIVVASSALAAAPALASTHTLHVKPKGKDGGSCTAKKPCKTIGFAITKAHSGDTIVVGHGTYKESVAIARTVHLVGVGRPVINAKGFGNGVLVSGAKSAGSSVRGFVVENATQEGILLMQTSRVTVSHNTIRNNDRGMFAATPTGECAAQGQVPGDCGEGLHLMTVSRARILDNVVVSNAGGILLSDEFGPTHDNLVQGNKANNNAYDCGITIVGHNMKAVSVPAGVLAPQAGGVYKNLILDNVANRNGLKGQGAGIVIAAGAPGSAVYNNTVEGNVANDDGLGGFTLHSHSPFQYFNGNKIIDNSFSHDALAGGVNSGPGDMDTTPALTKTAGIIIYSAVTPLKGIVVKGNKLSREYYGIWTHNVPTIKKKANTFAKSVKVDVYQS